MQTFLVARVRSVSFGVLLHVALGFSVVLLGGCGGDSSESSSPTAPSGSTTSVTVTVKNPIRMGESAQAAGTATRSNGQNETISTGWQSDQAGVATVTSAGLVSGVSNGRATIYLVSGGRQGQEVIRVVPDYQGRWRGTIRVVNCTHTGAFAGANFCGEFPVNSLETFDVVLLQSGEGMTATLFFASAPSQSVNAPIGADGTSAFSAVFTLAEEDLEFRLDTSWQVNSARIGELSGTINDVWRVAGVSGDARVQYAIVGAVRTSVTTRTPDGREHGRGIRALGRLSRVRP